MQTSLSFSDWVHANRCSSVTKKYFPHDKGINAVFKKVFITLQMPLSCLSLTDHIRNKYALLCVLSLYYLYLYVLMNTDQRDSINQS